MSIEIKKERCIGCSNCTQICPGSLLDMRDGKADILRPQRCWGCASCLKECPVQAIALFLGEDMGGLGGKLTVLREENLLHWTVERPDGSVRTITVDRSSSNQY